MHLANQAQPHNVAKTGATQPTVLQHHECKCVETRKSSQRVRGESKSRDIQIIIIQCGLQVMNYLTGFSRDMKTNTKRSLVEKPVWIFFLFRVSSSTACCDVGENRSQSSDTPYEIESFTQRLVAPPKHTKQIENTYKTQ